MEGNPEPQDGLNEIIQKGTDDTPEVGMLKVTTSPGYTVVYDTKTGVDSIINNNNLSNVLRKKRLDGSLVFERVQKVIPVVGQFNCLLHKGDPNRAHYDAIGLAVCPKEGLASKYQQMRHMQKRHKTEWGGVEQERMDAEKQEDRAFQRELMGKVIGKEPERELYVSDKDKEKVTA